jgi:hypothetical protein
VNVSILKAIVSVGKIMDVMKEQLPGASSENHSEISSSYFMVYIRKYAMGSNDNWCELKGI